MMSHDVSPEERESPQVYESLFTNNHAVMLLIDPESGAIVDANPAACMFYGYSRAALRSLTISDINMLSRAQVYEEMQRARQAQRNHFFFRHRLSSGEVREVEVYSGPIQHAGRLLLYSIIHDITKHRQAEEALRLGQAALQQANLDLEQRVAECTAELRKAQFALDHAVDEIFWVRADGRFVYVNHAACAGTGYTREELLTMSVGDIDPGLSADAWGMQWQNLKQRGAAIEETYHRGKDGQVYPVEVTATYMVVDAQACVCAFVRNTTHHKQTEEELRQSEAALQMANARLEQRVAERTEALRQSQALLQSVLDHAPAAIYLKDLEGHFLLINRFTEWLLNLSPSQMLGKTGYDLFPAEYAAQWEGHEQQVLQAGAPIECEEEALLSDGEAHRFLSSRFPIFDARGVIVATGGISTDITERKKIEDALYESEKRYRSIFEHATIGIFRSTLSGRFLSANPSLVRMLGYTSEREVLTMIWDIAEQVYTNPDLRREIVQQILDHETASLEHWYHRRDGSRFFGSLNVWAVRDASGMVRHLEGCVEDITDRKEAEEDLRRARKAAETASQAKSAFLARMSHEFRTPLNAILGFTQLLNRDQQVVPRHREYLRTIQRGGERLLALINDVLEMSRIEAGRVELHDHIVDLHHLLRDLADMFRPRASSKYLSLHLDLAPDVPLGIVTDEGKLRQVLINLLSNAIKFTKQGGVTLRVRVQDEMPKEPVAEAPSPSPAPESPLSSFSPRPEQVFLRFKVEDTGVGIAPDYRSHIFDPFFQIPRSDQSQEGTGLGLPISQHFVRMMGGDLHVESRPGQGSTFAFVLPVRLTEAVRDTSHRLLRRVVGLAPGQPSYRILIVEDHEDNRTMLHELLTSLGFDVRGAADGREGIAVWEQWFPHLIFMDIRMPVLDGVEATRVIKTTEQGQATPIVALTASAFEENRIPILAAGCDDFLRKPFRHEDIIWKLMKNLGVQFVCETAPEGEPQEEAAGGGSEVSFSDPDYLRAELAKLPFEWVLDLHRAAILGNIQQMYDLTDHLRTTHRELAGELQAAIDSFCFDQITAATTAIIDH